MILLSIAMVLVPIILTGMSFLLIAAFIGTTEDFQIESVLEGHEIAQIFMIDMITCIVAILLISVIVMRRFIQLWFMQPLSELIVAMGNIAEGNLDYQLENEYTAEMGELFKNYEEMRRRLKESTEESMENERKNRELVSNISHDLKTPITSIRGYVEGIMDGVADSPEKMEKYIRTIYKKSNELSSLINELTLYSNIDQNRVPYNFRKVHVGEFFEDCIEEFSMELESAEMELDYICKVNPETYIIADVEQFHRVIANIVGNTVKYRKHLPEDRVQIRVLDHGASVKIEIEDNGPGIGEKELPRIFERFYRTDASRSSITGGSGIGLSIVKKVVEDHDGTVWATSTEGVGTCVHILMKKYKKQDSKIDTEADSKETA